VSCVFVTRVESTLGFFDMMTPPRHRRRGAARAVLTQALKDAAAEGDTIDSIVFWSTPLGRPLYESLGFVVADTLDVWTFRASPEDMAAVGSG
jgi:ribosomal protein S18 acetylase RimI-like enzyme